MAAASERSEAAARARQLERTSEAIKRALEFEAAGQGALKMAGGGGIQVQAGDPFAAVDIYLDALPIGNIAFNAPQSVNLEKTAQVQLLLSIALESDELKRMVQQAGEKVADQIRVSQRMEARLTGPNFTITAVTPEQQAISGSGVTEWKWEIKPQKEGTHNLHLTLSALIAVDGSTTMRAMRTFDRNIEVEVTWDQYVAGFATKNWQWLWAVFLAPVAGWLWSKRHRSTGRTEAARIG